MQLLLEMSDKPRSFAGNDGLGHAMQTQHASNVLLGVLLNLVVGVH
jgi:hypothetical protein